MPRFYLDILNGRQVLEDPDGQEFADVHAAMAEAAASARDLVAHGIQRNEDLSRRSMLIRDDAGETVASVPFRSALPGTLSTSPSPGQTKPYQMKAYGPASTRTWSDWSRTKAGHSKDAINTCAICWRPCPQPST